MKKLIWLMASYCALTSANAQTQRLQLIEEFTGENCPPCAATNPGFNALLEANTDKIIAIKYQSPIPSAGPLYHQNESDVDARLNYYGVNSAPNARHDGLVFAQASANPGHPANFTQTNINQRAAVTSPFTIKLNHRISSGGDSIYATAIIKAVQSISGALVAHMVVIEKEILFTTPPGTNGEKKFEEVMKKMLPTKSGTTLPTSFATGDSVIVNVSWKLANIYDLSKVEVVAFVQNNTSKEVLQAGYSPSVFGPVVNIATTSAFLKGKPSTPITLNSIVNPVSTDNNDYKIILGKTTPLGWSASLKVNGIISTKDTVTIAASNSQALIDIVVTPGSKPGVGTFTLSISSASYIPNTLPEKKIYKVISNVTDLVIDNDGGKTWENYYMSALGSLGDTTKAVVKLDDMIGFSKSNSLSDVKNIFFNCGYGPNSLTEESVPALKSFLDNSGNLFISGQDIGWQTWAGSNIPEARDFYTNYLNAIYVKDASQNKSITAVASDAVFGTTSGTTVSDVYGAGSTYLDIIKPRGSAVAAFLYGTNPDSVAGIRSDNGHSKIVYLGVGVEMLTTSAVRSDIIKKSYNWFMSGPCALIDVKATKDGIKCFGDGTKGSVELTPTGGSGNYSYNWSNGNSTNQATNLNPGSSYIVTITDVTNNCTIQKQYSFVEPTQLAVSINGNDTITGQGTLGATIAGGVAPYTFSWNSGATINSTDVTASGPYTVVVTDGNNCTASAALSVVYTEIVGIKNNTLSKNNLMISPNPANDYIDLSLNLNHSEPVSIKIFNILGTKVFEKNESATDKLNTRIDISSQPVGIYFVKIETKSESITQKVLIK